MNLKVVEKKKNPLLKRKELVVKIANQGSTPKESDLIDKLSAVLDADSGLFEIKTIKQKFGTQESVAFVNLYDSTEAFKKIAPKKKEGDEKEKKEEKDENVPDESGQIKVDLDEPSEEEAEKKEEKPEKKEEKKEESEKKESKEEKPAKEEKEKPQKKEEKKEKEKVAPKEKEEKSE
ncbi:MAG: hypothetical protein R6U26_02555 [Candidatus Undinarchaeales archaeon]